NPGTEWISGSQGTIGAIAVIGSNMTFRDLKIIGFGTKAARECFPMGVFLLGLPYAPMHLGNILIEDCVVSDPATNNNDGLTAMVLAGNPPDTLTNAIMRRCTVKGMRPYFYYSHGMETTYIEDSQVIDCQIGVYFEPNTFDYQSFGPVVLRRNKFLNVDYGLQMLYHPGATFDSILFQNNEVALEEGIGWGFYICDICGYGPPGSITNATVLNNLIRFNDWLPRPQSQNGGVFYGDIYNAVFGNNVCALSNIFSLRVRSYPVGMIPAAGAALDC